MRPTIVVLPGDGIGPAVVTEALRVLDAVGFSADYVHGDIGWQFWCQEGNALPARTIALLKQHRVGLLGAITSKPEREAQHELASELRGKGLRYLSPIVALRQELRLATNVRPCLSIAGNPLNFVRRRLPDPDHPDATVPVDEPRVDIVVISQNTECLFAGVEWDTPPPAVRDAILAHPRGRWLPAGDLAVSCRIATAEACRDIAEAAFAYARANRHPSVTLCDKWGVMRATSARFREAAEVAAAQHPGVELRTMDVDTLILRLTRTPEMFSVILCSALLGDIVSDACAGLVGGRGFAPSASIGPSCAVFEPVHGSAPRRAHHDPPIVNPIATILSAALLLDHVGDRPRGDTIRNAVARVVRTGSVRTYDLGGRATTRQMADAIVAALR